MSRLHELTGPEKAAILLLSLGHESASRVLKEFTEDEVSEVVTEIAALHVVERETVSQIVEVFSETRKQDAELCRGGINQAASWPAGPASQRRRLRLLPGPRPPAPQLGHLQLERGPGQQVAHPGYPPLFPPIHLAVPRRLLRQHRRRSP